MNFLGRAYQKAVDTVTGIRTLAVAGAVVMLGLASYFDLGTIRPLLDSYLGQDKSSKIMIFLPVVFGFLRWISDGPVRWKKREDERISTDPDCNQKDPH